MNLKEIVRAWLEVLRVRLQLDAEAKIRKTWAELEPEEQMLLSAICGGGVDAIVVDVKNWIGATTDPLIEKLIKGA